MFAWQFTSEKDSKWLMRRALVLEPFFPFLRATEIIDDYASAESFAGPVGIDEPSVHTQTGLSGELIPVYIAPFLPTAPSADAGVGLEKLLLCG